MSLHTERRRVRTEAPGLQPVARATVVDVVSAQLRTQILSGAYAPGTRLPPERDLAEQLGVNRLTLRAAVSRLEALGLVSVQHGAGTTVRDYRAHGVLEALPELLRIARERDLEAYRTLLRDALELRRTIAAEAVALAAERHSAADLAQIRALVSAQKSRVEDPLAFAQGDLEVARAVVRATGNLGLELLLNALARYPASDPELTRAMYPAPRAQFTHYDVLLGLLESRDAARARDTMREALLAIDQLTFERVTRALTQRTPAP